MSFLLSAASSARRRPALPQTYEQLALAFGARGYWKLDDTGSVAVDSSGNGYDGDYTASGLTKGVPPLRTGALAACRLDSTSGGVRLPNPSNVFTFALGDFTLEVIASWTDSGSVFGSLLFNGSQNVTGDNAWRLIYRYGGADNIPRVDFNTAGLLAFPSPASGIEHIVFRMQGTAISMFRNGTLVASATTTARPSTGFASDYIRMGGGYSSFSSSYGLLATVSDVAIYPSALSDAQILAHSQSAGLT